MLMRLIFALVGPLCFLASATAEDPPRKLTPEERDKLESDWERAKTAAIEYANARKLPEAEVKFREALRLAQLLYPAREFPNGHPTLAASLNNLGKVLMDQGNITDSERFFRAALQMKKKLYPPDKFPDGTHDLASSLNNLASLLQEQAKFEEADPLFRESLEMFIKLYPLTKFPNGHPNVAIGFGNLGNNLKEQAKYTEAVAHLWQAVEIWERLIPREKFPQGHPELTVAWNNLAVLLQAQGKFAESEALYRATLKMRKTLYARQFPDGHPDIALSLENLANVLHDQGQLSESVQLFRDGLKMWMAAFPPERYRRGHPDIARSMANLARVLFDVNQYAEAESLSLKALAMYRAIFPPVVLPNGHPDIAKGLAALSRGLDQQGRYAQAEELAREAYEMRKKLYPPAEYPNGHPQILESMNALVTFLDLQRKYAESERILREVVSISEKLYPKSRYPSGHHHLARSYSNLAATLEDLGKFEEAESLCRKALSMRRELFPASKYPNGTQDIQTSLGNLAVVLIGAGKFQQAETAGREALAMAIQLFPKEPYPDGHRLIASEYSKLASTLWRQGKDTEAGKYHHLGTAAYYRLIESYAKTHSEGETLSFLAKEPVLRDSYVANTLLSKSNRYSAADIYPNVWARKGLLSRVYEGKHLSARAASTNPETQELIKKLNAMRKERANRLLAADTTDPATRKKRSEEIGNYSQEIQQLEQKLRTLFPDVERSEKLARATVSDLQKALPADSVLIDILHCGRMAANPDKPGRAGESWESSYIAFIVSPSKISWVHLGRTELVEAIITQWRQSIATGKTIPVELGGSVRDILWNPIQKELPNSVKTIFISPDSALCRIPWIAIQGVKPDTILLDDYAIAMIPHGKFLLHQLLPNEKQSKAPAELLTIGGVDYNSKVSLPRATDTPQRDALIKPENQTGWLGLPGTTVEAQGVANLAVKKNLTTTILRTDQASVSNVLEKLPQARFAHFATHGFFADPQFRSAFQLNPKGFEISQHGERVGRAALSPLVMAGLVLAGANIPTTPGRGILTGEALVDLDLSGLELAVLSACETGLGDVADGEGTFGLQRAFQLAGTRNVVASLWKVPDQSTAALMSLFYDNLWDKKLSPIQALRHAQLEIYRNPNKIPTLAAGFRAKFEEVPGSSETTLPKVGADGKAHPILWAAFTLSGVGR